MAHTTTTMLMVRLIIMMAGWFYVHTSWREEVSATPAEYAARLFVPATVVALGAVDG